MEPSFMDELLNQNRKMLNCSKAAQCQQLSFVTVRLRGEKCLATISDEGAQAKRFASFALGVC